MIGQNTVNTKVQANALPMVCFCGWR